jgi:hypothetical protein
LPPSSDPASWASDCRAATSRWRCWRTAWPGHTQRIHWSFDDPSAATGSDEQHLAFRNVREGIHQRLRLFQAVAAARP